MSTRYSKVKDALMRYRLKTKEKKTRFMEYLREERHRIVARERKKLVKRMMFWTVFLGGGWLIYEEIYRKIMEKTKMTKKLDYLYPSICERETFRDQLTATMLSPQNLDELANIVSLAYRYHFKIIVRMDDMSKKEKLNITQKFDSKCLFLNISALNHIEINSINNTLYAQAGATCQQVNERLTKAGYSKLFPVQLNNEKIYDVVVNNLPLNNGELSKAAISMELLSAFGQSFRSAGETNRYGQIPSLNPLFIGTGGIFALPCAVNLRISPQKNGIAEQALKINIKDINEQVVSLRKMDKLGEYVDIELTNVWAGKQEDQLYAVCRERQPTYRQTFTDCSKLANTQNIPVNQLQPDYQRINYNLYFSVNPTIFQDFLLKSWKLPYECRNGLLKVKADEQNYEQMLAIINQITLLNGALVWCKQKELLMRIKPSLDSSEVGAELMRKIVEVREGLDHRGVLYSHSRYEDYFAKGIFRKLTEFFW